MSHPDPKKDYTDEELDQMSKDHTREVLSQAIHATRQEYGGIPLEEVAETFFVHYDQAEMKSFIEKQVDIYGKKYGRLYE